jgi:hypothetical protein
MSQSLAFANAWSLATTLMACVVVFKTEAGDYGVMVASEYDGDTDALVHEFDPYR